MFRDMSIALYSAYLSYFTLGDALDIPTSSSITSYHVCSIAHNHHTNIHPLLNIACFRGRPWKS